MKISYRADSVELEGYVVAFKRDSRPLRDRTTKQYFYEQVLPGAFDRELQVKEIPVLLNHMHDRKIGSSRTNFEFSEDPIGLKVKAVIPDPEVIEKAKAGRLKGWSFAFKDFLYETEALSDDEMAAAREPVEIRKKLYAMTLLEISLIDDRKVPCYEGTLVSVLDAGLDGSISGSVHPSPEYYEDLRNKIQKLEGEQPKEKDSTLTAEDAKKRIAEIEISSYKNRIKTLKH